MIVKNITIVLTGRMEEDCEDALNEAIRLIRDGYLSGTDSNEDGSYGFTVTESIDNSKGQS